jgi:2-(1,2-epoxy-1,2-dihydrophenyl)acetyl-CoA isomerase
MAPEPLVKLRRQGRIAVVSLNRPARHNALVPELLSELLNALEHDDCRDAAGVVLRAEGRSFSTGGDLLGFQRHKDTIGDYSNHLVSLLNRVILAIYTLPAPVACSVHGQVTGGSLGLLLASDRVVMRRGVTVTPWYSAVGFSPDGGWTALLPGVIGRQQALRWLAGNASHDADDCLALGLAHEVVASDCDRAALDWIERILKMNTNSVNLSRRLLNSDIEVLRVRLDAEREAFVRQIQTQQAFDGIDHFLRRHKNV